MKLKTLTSNSEPMAKRIKTHNTPKRARNWPLTVMLISLSCLALSGCVSLAVGAAATGGAVIAQERSVGDAIDDLTIRAHLNELFFAEDVDLLQSVSFAVVEGRVLLKGSVVESEDRIRAVRLTWQADGVREVINEIQVTDQDSVLNFARDTWISTQLKSIVLFDKDIYSINYNIETVNGTIYLMGIAQNEAELEKVTNHARTIDQVKRVVSHVVMRNDPRREKTP